jgi:hypothetical protein
VISFARSVTISENRHHEGRLGDPPKVNVAAMQAAGMLDVCTLFGPLVEVLPLPFP